MVLLHFRSSWNLDILALQEASTLRASEASLQAQLASATYKLEAFGVHHADNSTAEGESSSGGGHATQQLAFGRQQQQQQQQQRQVMAMLLESQLQQQQQGLMAEPLLLQLSAMQASHVELLAAKSAAEAECSHLRYRGRKGMPSVGEGGRSGCCWGVRDTLVVVFGSAGAASCRHVELVVAKAAAEAECSHLRYRAWEGGDMTG